MSAITQKDVIFLKCEKLFAEIDRLYDKYVGVWEEICNIESQTADKAGVDKVGAFCVAWAEKRGYTVDRFPQERVGDVLCITMNEGATGTPICLSGHMDTVHPRGLFGYPPVRIEGDKIYGPGVEDCKGGIVAGMLAMEALDNCGFSARPVRLLLQSDEENGSSLSNKATIGYICERAKGAVAFFNLEGYSKGKASIARKGIVTYTIRVTGKSAHASKCATEGANAIAEAAHKIIELEKLKDEAGLTCNCGVITGGSVPNTVPAYCEFKINIRFVNEEQLCWVRDYVQKIVDTVYVPGCTSTVAQSTFRVAMEDNPRNRSLLDQMNAIWSENGLSTLVGVLSKGGSDAADVTASGTPCVDSIGVRGDFVHSKDEFAYLDSLSESAKRVASVVYCFE